MARLGFALLEAENSRALQDEFVRVQFDMSRAIVVATANDVSLLPDYIRDRLTTFMIAPPADAALLVVARLSFRRDPQTAAGLW